MKKNKWIFVTFFLALNIVPNFQSLANVYKFKADFRLVPPDMFYVDNVPAGPIREIVDLAVTRAGHQIVWKETPWKRTQEMAAHGQTDILVRHSMNDQRSTFLSPILMGYQEREMVFVIAPNKDVVIEKFEDLQKYNIGQQRGYFYAPQYNAAKNINKTTVNRHEQLIKLLEIGRVDAVVMTSDLKNDIDLLLSVKGAKVAGYKMTFFNGRYCSIAKKSPAIKYVNEISAEIFKLRKSGEMTKIMNMYGSKPFIQDFTTQESKAQELLIK
jgi:polar amino acid transport system substrate-binding protein